MWWILLLVITVTTAGFGVLRFTLLGLVRPAWGEGDIRKYPTVDVRHGGIHGTDPHPGWTPIQWNYDGNGYAPRKRLSWWMVLARMALRLLVLALVAVLILAAMVLLVTALSLVESR